MKKYLITLLILTGAIFQTQLFSYSGNIIGDTKCSEINETTRYSNLSPTIIEKIDLIGDRINEKYKLKDNVYKEKVYNLFEKVLNEHLAKTTYSGVQKEVLLRIGDYFVCKKEGLNITEIVKQTIFEVNIGVPSIIRKESGLKDFVNNAETWEITTIQPTAKLNSMEIELTTEIGKTYELKIQTNKNIKLRFSDGSKSHESVNELGKIITTSFKATVTNQRIWIQPQNYGTTTISNLSIIDKENTLNNNSNIFISSTNENQMQTESEIIESKNSTSLISKTRISKHLSSGETWKFENGYMSNISDIGIEIIGSVGTNQTVIIKASKFTNIKLPLRILYVDNVIIEGNYFQDMWSGIHVAYAKNITVRYNKFERHGVKPGRSNTSWAGNFLHLNSCNLDTLSIEHNLVDRSSDSRPNKQENTFAEDHLSIYHTKMVGGNKGYISNNYIMGSEKYNESATGGGITIDQYGSGFVIENNYIYNTGSFLIGLASSQNLEILNNLGFMTQVHDSYISTNAKHVGSDNSGPNKNSQLTITEWHAEGSPASPVNNVIIRGNRLLAKWHDGSQGSQWLDVDLNELHMSNNSFIKHKWDGNTGVLSHPTQKEVFETIVGIDHAGMFATHGQGANYFDESRIVK